ncbi:unnamed protein product [Linum tenue]|uniref:Uncharacterized protein n=1 Tax=Linum tenue TaxID=586396 RepID=A0AAV0L743_9ROSI|nr:unnamed protein product [Linum tenue]
MKQRSCQEPNQTETKYYTSHNLSFVGEEHQASLEPCCAKPDTDVRKIFFDAGPELFKECLLKFRKTKGKRARSSRNGKPHGNTTKILLP